MGLSAVIISVVSCLLNLLSVHYPDQPSGLTILKTLFLPQWYQKLNTHLHGSHSELILVTMKLYTAMSNFAGGRERKVVVEVFAWDNKVAKLLNMRRRGRGEMKGTLSRPGGYQCRSFLSPQFYDHTSHRYQDTLCSLHPFLHRPDNPHQFKDNIPGAAQGVVGCCFQRPGSGPLPSNPVGP